MEALSFEQCIDRLEALTKMLEQGEVSLEDSMRYYEEATALAAKCKGMLEKAEQTVKQLSQTPEGKFFVEDFQQNES